MNQMDLRSASEINVAKRRLADEYDAAPERACALISTRYIATAEGSYSRLCFRIRSLRNENIADALRHRLACLIAQVNLVANDSPVGF